MMESIAIVLITEMLGSNLKDISNSIIKKSVSAQWT